MKNKDFEHVRTNLFDFYSETGRTLNCVQSETDQFIALHTDDAQWPNLSFFKGIQDEFENAFSQLKEQEPLTFICPKTAIHPEFSKPLLALGYVPYGKWQGMSLNLRDAHLPPVVTETDQSPASIADLLNRTLLANAPISVQTIEKLRTIPTFKFHTEVFEEQAISTLASYNTQACAGIYFVATLTEFRQRGFASKLLSNTLSTLKNNKINQVILHATPAGIPLYQKFGFVPTEEFVLFRKK
jgi:GNAT superfamily N-acetyltransferase